MLTGLSFNMRFTTRKTFFQLGLHSPANMVRILFFFHGKNFHERIFFFFLTKQVVVHKLNNDNQTMVNPYQKKNDDQLDYLF